MSICSLGLDARQKSQGIFLWIELNQLLGKQKFVLTSLPHLIPVNL